MIEGESSQELLRSTPENSEESRTIITGGTEGIGKAVAQQFIGRGDKVAICARDKRKLEEMKEGSPNLIAEVVDISDRHAGRDFVYKAGNEMGGLDLLILNAATSGIPGRVETEEEKNKRTDYIFLVNQVAQVALTRAALSMLRESHGTVVFITSGLARLQTQPPGSEEYARSKARIEKYLSNLSTIPENQGIKIFSINPGPVDTRMHEEIIERGPEILAQLSTNAKALGLLRDPEVIGKIVAKLASTGMDYNPETKEYDLPIENASVVDISSENIEFESRPQALP